MLAGDSSADMYTLAAMLHSLIVDFNPFQYSLFRLQWTLNALKVAALALVFNSFFLSHFDVCQLVAHQINSWVVRPCMIFQCCVGHRSTGPLCIPVSIGSQMVAWCWSFLHRSSFASGSLLVFISLCSSFYGALLVTSIASIAYQHLMHYFPITRE